MNFTAVTRFFVKRERDARVGGCVKNRPVLGLGGEWWVHPTLHLNDPISGRYCDASYGARSRESDLTYGPIVPRSFANEWGERSARHSRESRDLPWTGQSR